MDYFKRQRGKVLKEDLPEPWVAAGLAGEEDCEVSEDDEVHGIDQNVEDDEDNYNGKPEVRRSSNLLSQGWTKQTMTVSNRLLQISELVHI